MRKRNLLPLAAVVLLCLAAGCRQEVIVTQPEPVTEQPSAPVQPIGPQPTSGSRLDQVKKAGKLMVGLSADYPPYEFHKETNKKDDIVGFDVEIAKLLAKELGVTLELKEMKYEQLLASLEAGQIDCIISAMSPTPERQQKADFSNVYYKAVNKVIVRAEDQDKFTTTDELKGRKLGAQKGSAQERLVKAQLPGVDLLSIFSMNDLALELKNKKIDGIVAELPVAKAYIAKNKDLAIAELALSQEDQGAAVAVKKGSRELLLEINKTIEKLRADKTIERLVVEANELVG